PPAPAVTVVARTDPATIDAWAARWKAEPPVVRVQPAETVGGDVSAVDIEVTGDSQSTAAQDLVRRMRAERPAGVQSWITGDAAVLTDLLTLIRRGLPAAITVTLLAMVILLFAMTGSL